ncbi:hypothetical protein C6W88_15730 [Halomonas litopenaei]|uniref:DUF1508 domain-containing protein n=1 Tax=Halomonas litopenaei TaxID=2109328 RepID=A0ABX5ITH3_9GAMM|nr:hypothetical protein C6W88_15730 [Halomonas litopenaei]
MIKRAYFYSATRRNKSGEYAWWQGTFSIRSWFPASARDLAEIAKGKARKGMDEISAGQVWHDRTPRLVALNRL